MPTFNAISRMSTPEIVLPSKNLNSLSKVAAGLVSIYMFVDNKFFLKSYFSDRLTFSNIRRMTSRRIYKLALPLCVPDTLSSLSKSKISIINAHLTLFVRRMTSHNSISKYSH